MIAGSRFSASRPHLQLLHVIDFSAPTALALRTLARARAIKALPAVTGSLALGALA